MIGSVDDDLGQRREFFGEIPEFLGVAQDVAYVDAKHLTVLERIERLAPRGTGSVRGRLWTSVDGGQRGLELALQFGPCLAGVECIGVADNREQVMRIAKSSQRLADPQQVSQPPEHFRVLE